MQYIRLNYKQGRKTDLVWLTHESVVDKVNLNACHQQQTTVESDKQSVQIFFFFQRRIAKLFLIQSFYSQVSSLEKVDV